MTFPQPTAQHSLPPLLALLFSLKHLNFIYHDFSDDQAMNVKISHGVASLTDIET